MTDRVPQLDDDVVIVLTLPASTEEWAEDSLDGLAVEIERTDEALCITQVIKGNCNALDNAASFLRDVQDALADVDIDPMQFMLAARAEPRR